MWNMWNICETYVRHMWDICETYVKNTWTMWNTCETYVKYMWNICETTDCSGGVTVALPKPSTDPRFGDEIAECLSNQTEIELSLGRDESTKNCEIVWNCETFSGFLHFWILVSPGWFSWGLLNTSQPGGFAAYVKTWLSWWPCFSLKWLNVAQT